MVHYKVYARKDLQYIDGGVVRDYNIDFDLISDNTSYATIIDTSSGFKGDIIALTEGNKLIELGVITSIDNTEKKISFKQMNELFNDSVINVFKYTDTLKQKFEGVKGLKTILTLAYLQNSDPEHNLPIVFKTFGTASGCVYSDDDDTINLKDFILWMFDKYNVFLDFSIDFTNNKIVCTITKNSTEGYIIKDNIKLSKPEFDNNDMPAYNRAVLYNNETGNIEQVYYLLSDNTVSTNPNNQNRVLPVSSKYVSWDETTAVKEGYTMEQLAMSELCGNIYNHCILYKLSKDQQMVKCRDFKYGDKVSIIYQDREYQSIFTGLKYSMNSPYYTCVFGKTRIDFTDRMKLYNNKRFKRRN